MKEVNPYYRITLHKHATKGHDYSYVDVEMNGRVCVHYANVELHGAALFLKHGSVYDINVCINGTDVVLYIKTMDDQNGSLKLGKSNNCIVIDNVKKHFNLNTITITTRDTDLPNQGMIRHNFIACEVFRSLLYKYKAELYVCEEKDES